MNHVIISTCTTQEWKIVEGFIVGQEIFIEQKQILNLTPQMHQSIKVLQMNMIELNHWLEQESQGNPILEVEFDDPIEIKETKEPDNFYFPSEWKNNERINFKPIDEEKNQQSNLSQTVTLYDHLLLSLRISVKDEIDYKIGEYIIGNLDQNGYLVMSCLEISRDLNIPEKRVRRVLAMVQNSSVVPGLGARSLKECLLIQLKYLKLEEKGLLKKIILFYLKELSERKFKEISQALNVSYDKVQDLLDILVKNFDPKPGRVCFQEGEVNFLIPDIIVKKIDGEYEIIENKGVIPSIKINPVYQNMILQGESEGDFKKREAFAFNEEQIDEQEKTIAYIKRKVSQAKWMIRCVERRRKTLFDITQFIIHYQQEFLEKGVAYLKPLSMKMAANSLGYHESTISRAVNGKKIQLPKGFYDLKYFFSKALPQDDQEEISNERIKSLLKKHVSLEDPHRPYSDQELSEVLRIKEKISVARRTITKYRKVLNISSSKIRKKYIKKEN
ncbi:MAG: RNA polymerase factor sigma-54 [Candidatus Atribacteria bacterium]|nr:RNA polymerase factor sigma-54 [Candidatus Atribacteria bacterium]